MRGRHFWTHFWCGLILGGLLGARIFWGDFSNPLALIGCAAAFAVVFALVLAYFGDPLWTILMDFFSWW